MGGYLIRWVSVVIKFVANLRILLDPHLPPEKVMQNNDS